jgi:hypothetical protein
MYRDSVTFFGRFAGAITLIGASNMVGAVDLGDRVALNGYGSQSYFQTSANLYLDADHRGTWDNNFLGLVGAVTLSDRSKLWAQLQASTEEVTHFTWFFVDYQLTDSLTAHAGRVKLPLGLYNEIIDAKFLQLSSLEPSLYQTAADFVHDSYNGVGIDYNQDAGAAGRILWQVYGGNTHDPAQPINREDRRMVGARITYATPVDGLRFLVSAYLTQVDVLGPSTIGDQAELLPIGLINETRWIGSVDYLRSDWDLKAEYARHSFDRVSSYAYYFQAGRTFADKWTPFVRYDYVTTDKSKMRNDAYVQKTMVGGVNYRLVGNISLRAEAQQNLGFALPVASGEQSAATAKRNWVMLIVGAHFIF